jgi:hypothetical protein
MAREAGIKHDIHGVWCEVFELKAFTALVRADERNSLPAEMEAMERQVNILTDALAESRREILAEREACAVIAETPIICEQDDITMHAKDRVAAAIRARGNT